MSRPHLQRAESKEPWKSLFFVWEPFFIGYSEVRNGGGQRCAWHASIRIGRFKVEWEWRWIKP